MNENYNEIYCQIVEVKDYFVIALRTEKGYIHSTVANKEGIYYEHDTSIMQSTGTLSKYQYRDKSVTQSSRNKIEGRTVYISDDGKEIYYVNGVELRMKNLETNDSEVIFIADQSKEAINNAHILEMR